MPRPSINEDIIETIKQIHREKQGEPAGDFQEALDTVVQLAIEDDEEMNIDYSQSRGERWYPGKYAGMVIDQAARDLGLRETRSRGLTDATQPVQGSVALVPDRSAIFKARLADDRVVTIPSAEADAVGFESGDIVQVIAYEMEDRSEDQSTDS